VRRHWRHGRHGHDDPHDPHEPHEPHWPPWARQHRHRHRPPWWGRPHHWPHDLRSYYGAHLHRRLFFWFGAIILVAAVLGGLFSRTHGHVPGHPLVYIVIALWLMSRKVARWISRPLYELVNVSKQIGQGNLAARADLDCNGIDEIAALARSMNDMAARIERQLADQRELLAGVSHELRTPLARMRVLLDIARERGAEPRTYDQIERELLEMDRLVGELLASARLDFQALSPKPLDAGEAAGHALERAGLPADKLARAPGADLRFEGDPTLVGRALANLIDNAQKHGRGLQRLGVRAEGGFVVFTVEDAGPGFPPGTEARAFEPFARVGGEERPEAPTETSLGLGLSLVARIARAHGGKVSAANLPGGGACVTLQLAVKHQPARVG
jgi:signal transduction histidine kinase